MIRVAEPGDVAPIARDTAGPVGIEPNLRLVRAQRTLPVTGLSWTDGTS